MIGEYLKLVSFENNCWEELLIIKHGFQNGVQHFKATLVLVGASLVKWSKPNACLGSSKSDSKLYTYFQFYEEKNLRTSKNIWIYKVKQFMMTKAISRTVYIF